MIRCSMIRDAILMCAQTQEADTSQLNLPQVTKDYRSDKNEKVKNGYAQKYR